MQPDLQRGETGQARCRVSRYAPPGRLFFDIYGRLTMVEVEHVISNAIYGAIRRYASDAVKADDTWLTPKISRHLALAVLADLEKAGWTLTAPK